MSLFLQATGLTKSRISRWTIKTTPVRSKNHSAYETSSRICSSAQTWLSTQKMILGKPLMRLNSMKSSETRHQTESSKSRPKTSQPKTNQTPLQVICLRKQRSILTQWELWKGPKDLVTLPLWTRFRTQTSPNHNKTTFGHLTSMKRLENLKRASSRSTFPFPNRGQKAPKSTIFPRRPSHLMPLPWAMHFRTVQVSSSMLLQSEAQWSKMPRKMRQETTATSSSQTWTST